MILVKIGGGRDVNLPGIAEDLAEVSAPFIVVHGANAVRDAIAAKLGTPTQVVTSVSGYTSVLSDKAALDAILMGYAGVQNKRIVELLQQHGVNAVGLSGIDGRAIQGQRNKGIRVRKNGKTLIVRDFSGKPRSANKELFQLLLDGGYAPVLSIPIIDERHTAINSRERRHHQRAPGGLSRRGGAAASSRRPASSRTKTTRARWFPISAPPSWSSGRLRWRGA